MMTVKDTFYGWNLQNINENIDDTSKVYFLERTDSGFYIVFGGNYDDDLASGLVLNENAKVIASYITSSGELGNGVGAFTTDFTIIDTATTAVVNTVSPSSGGAVDPNLDAVKFFAPKWFSAQDRVVTKNDAISALSRTFISEDTPDADTRLSVWGGEENEPPMYGRLFVSLLNEDPNSGIVFCRRS